jgi:hypothetical protein
MNFRTIIIIFFFISFDQAGRAQSISLQLGTQIPLMYSGGFEFEFKKGLALNAQAGILTKPYDAAILEALKMFGTNEALVNTIGDAFSYGYVMQPAIKYHYRKWITGITYSYFSLVAKDAPVNLIENYYDVSLPPAYRNIQLRLDSKLQNAGMLVGRRIILKNPDWQIVLECSLVKTFWSRSKLTTENVDLYFLSTAIDLKLQEYYIEYGYLPSINLFLTRKIR